MFLHNRYKVYNISIPLSASTSCSSKDPLIFSDEKRVWQKSMYRNKNINHGLIVDRKILHISNLSSLFTPRTSLDYVDMSKFWSLKNCNGRQFVEKKPCKSSICYFMESLTTENTFINFNQLLIWVFRMKIKYIRNKVHVNRT